jgi:hypothetical protein
VEDSHGPEKFYNLRLSTSLSFQYPVSRKRNHYAALPWSSCVDSFHRRNFTFKAWQPRQQRPFSSKCRESGNFNAWEPLIYNPEPSQLRSEDRRRLTAC